MSIPPDLVCVGRIVREMIYFPGEVKGPVLGSPPAYCSVAAARQGTRTGIVTKIGSDFPEVLLQPIIKSGVNLAGLIRGDRTTSSELIYDTQGNKEIRYPGISTPIRQQDIPSEYHNCALIYICPMDEDVLLEDMPGVVTNGRLSAVDLGGYGGVHMARARRMTFPSLEKLALDVSANFNIVKASDEDSVAIFGWDNPDEAAKKLLDCGPEVVVITMGKNGALVYSPEGQWQIPPIPGNVIDTTGGGDTFMAGFLSEYLRSCDPVLATRWGCSTAINVIEGSGGVRVERMPTREQVQARIDSSYP